MQPALVDRDRVHPAFRGGEQREELIERVCVASAGGALTPSAAQTLSASPRGSGNVSFMAGRHCSRPASSTCSSSLMSMRPARILTAASVPGESR